MSYIGIPPQANFSSGLLDRFTSTTGTTVTLTHDIASENDIVVFVNFVKQDSTTYSVGGTGNKTLTLGGTLVSSDIVEVHYLNIVGQTNAPSSGSVTTATINDNAITGAKLNTDVISAQTALAVAPDSTDELLISDAGVLKRIDVSLIGGNNTPYFYGALASNQVVSRGVDTKITGMTSNEIDTDSAFDGTTFTVPSGKGGNYFISATIQADFSSIGNDGERVRTMIYKNGSIIFRNVYYEQSTDSREVPITTNAIVSLSASDTIELYVSARDGSGDNPTINSDQKGTHIFGYKMIG